MVKRSVISVMALFFFFPSFGQDLKEELKRLDDALASSREYVAAKELSIGTTENLLHSRGVSDEQLYSIYGRLYDEYLGFNYEKAKEALSNQEAVARKIGDKNLVTSVLLNRAMLSTIGGLYLEASNLLTFQIDSASLDPQMLSDYCYVQQRFWFDYQEYLRQENAGPMMKKVTYYRDKLLELEPETSKRHQEMAVRSAMDRRNWGEADFLNRNLLAQMNPEDHEYAVQAYYQAMICDAQDRREDMAFWYTRSAIADVKNATKDNASLICLAQELFRTGDIDRAFNYTRISLDDAVFYDAKLRQWQIAAILPTIQDGYTDSQNRHIARNRRLMSLILLLAALVFCGAIYLLVLYGRQKSTGLKIARMNRKIAEDAVSLERVNARLKSMNAELTEANAAKEEYIGLFLSMCSSYIDKMRSYEGQVRKKLLSGKADELIRETSTHDLVDQELDHFYSVFDQAFLRLYPRFVPEFNALLRPGSRILLKEGELLNTELRIFALIRLGITQSSRIASFLRYSVNTIYNYRAQVKNAALGDRDSFEERIRTIGN